MPCMANGVAEQRFEALAMTSPVADKIRMSARTTVWHVTVAVTAPAPLSNAWLAFPFPESVPVKPAWVETLLTFCVASGEPAPAKSNPAQRRAVQPLKDAQIDHLGPDGTTQAALYLTLLFMADPLGGGCWARGP